MKKDKCDDCGFRKSYEVVGVAIGIALFIFSIYGIYKAFSTEDKCEFPKYPKGSVISIVSCHKSAAPYPVANYVLCDGVNQKEVKCYEE